MSSTTAKPSSLPRPRRSWRQFSLRSLLAVVTLASLPLGWLSVLREQKRHEREAVAAIERLGGQAHYSWHDEMPGRTAGPAWLRRYMGDDFFVHAVSVDLSRNGRLTDADLSCLAPVRWLKKLKLDQTGISNAGLVHLKSLKSLEHLSLLETDVTTPGALDLHRSLPDCQIVRYQHSANDGVGYAKVAVDGQERELAPIHQAARQGDIETIREELDEGVPVDLRVERGWGATPLMFAAARGKVAAVKFLIEAGADVDATNNTGTTPLMVAAGTIENIRGDAAACVAALLAAGADRDAADDAGRTAAYYACGQGNPLDEALISLVRRERRRPTTSSGWVSWSERHTWRLMQPQGDARRLELLLHAGCRIDTAFNPDEPLLLAACYSADAARIRLLLDAGAVADIRVYGQTPLTVAARIGDAEMFQVLLDASPEIPHGLLRLAAGVPQDAEEKVRLLLARGADVNEQSQHGETPLLAALLGMKSNAAIVLLDAGADPQLGKRDTLLLAAKYGPAAALHRLLELGFDPRQRSPSRPHASALMLAAASERDAVEKVKLLLQAGAELDAHDDRGATALLEASRAGNWRAVELLAEAGADVHVTDVNSGWTPLLYVANRGVPNQSFPATGGAAARTLIRHGASTTACDRESRSPAAVALAAEHDEVSAALAESVLRDE